MGSLRKIDMSQLRKPRTVAEAVDLIYRSDKLGRDLRCEPDTRAVLGAWFREFRKREPRIAVMLLGPRKTA